MPTLTAKQQRFAAEYALEGNAAKAARRAGYPDRSAKEIGCENLTKPHIQAEIKARQDELAHSTGLDCGKTLREIGMLAHSDIGDVYVDVNTGRLCSDFPEARRAVQSFEVIWDEPKKKGAKRRVKAAKIKYYDKRQAVTTVMEHQGLLNQKLPPLEVLLSRLPTPVAIVLRRLLANPNAEYQPAPIVVQAPVQTGGEDASINHEATGSESGGEPEPDSPEQPDG